MKGRKKCADGGMMTGGKMAGGKKGAMPPWMGKKGMMPAKKKKK